MNKQDRGGVRTAQDLERKYDFASIVGIKKAVKQQELGLIKTDTILEEFIKETLKEVESLQSQIDGNITTYFYSGVPTMDNPPANEWTDYAVHLGDLYYDTDTGAAYRFAKDGDNYNWTVVTDTSVTEALALASKAQDTADRKRRVFVVQPIPPYDEGDLWLYDKELYVCVKPKVEGNAYEEGDFTKAVKYTDDYALEQFITGEYADELKATRDQIDKKAETWYQADYPDKNWTDAEKAIHVNDLWYNTSDKNTYIYTEEYKWEVTSIAIPDDLFDKVDGKAQIFSAEPVPPYYVDDLYVQGKDGEIYVCIKERLEGSYVASDWAEACKYTDDSALNEFLEGEYLDDLKAISQQVDKKADTWYQDTDPSVNWSTLAEKTVHERDLWYNTSDNNTYIYTPEHKWEITSTTIPEDLFDKVDGKAQIFTEKPVPPYHKNDLYVQGKDGDILVCVTERLTGEYNASDWAKAGKYTDDTGLNNFVNDVYKEAMNSLNTQIDSKITTWFASGEPTLDNYPASDWTTDELKQEHKGDLYYDKDTGFAYRYDFEGSEYKWTLIRDRDTIEALAIANAASDTADGKRRVFTDEPYPPYENGDLWFDGEDIYICQVSKPEGETYAEGDFIIATKYTDDTRANEVGGELEVLQGTVLTIKEGVDEWKVEINNRDENTQAAIRLIEQSLQTLIKGKNGQSLMTQTENGWSFDITSIQTVTDAVPDQIKDLNDKTEATDNTLGEVQNTLAEVTEVTTYLKRYNIGEDPALELGTSANGFKSIYTNKGLIFVVDNNIDDPETEMTYDGMEIRRAIIREELQVGGFLLKKRANGNAGFVWRGEE